MITLVIPTLGDDAKLRLSVNSVRAHDPELPIIIVNDGREAFSTEARGIRVINLPQNLGPSAARNAGWRAAATVWVTFLDAGDLWLPGRGQQLRDALDRSDWQTWSAPRERRSTWFEHYQASGEYRLQALMKGCRFQPGSSLLIRRELLEAIGGYDEDLRRLEDYELFLRLAKSGKRLQHNDDGRVAVTEATGGNLGLVTQARAAILKSQHRDRQVRAYLHEEIAAAALRARRPVRATRHLAISFVLAPRLRRHLQPAEQRPLTDATLRAIEARLEADVTSPI